jgi:hypothetical protein
LNQGEDGSKDGLALRKRWSFGVKGRELKGWAGGNEIGLEGTKVDWVLAGKLEEVVNGVQPSLFDQGKSGKQRGSHSRLGHQSPQPWLLSRVADHVIFNLLLLFHVCHVLLGMKTKSLCPAHNCLLDLELPLALGNQIFTNSTGLFLDYKFIPWCNWNVGTKPNVMLVLSHMLVSLVQKPVDACGCWFLQVEKQSKALMSSVLCQPGRKWVHNNHFLFVFKENEIDKVQTNFHYNLLLSKEIGR